MTVSVLTLARGREAHLHQLIEGLRRSRRRPDELVVVDMNARPLTLRSTAFPIRIVRMPADRLPLAAARNAAARAAAGDALLFLDVDCIPMAPCVGRLVDELGRRDGLLCADIRYLGPDHGGPGWSEAELMRRGRAHPARLFPPRGVREEHDPGLFWSLAFAVRRASFEHLGGFDEGFEGYGGEDTDLGYRAAALGVPLLFVGGAVACHQHHPAHDPPVQHLDDIVRNARRFRARWGRWPMEGWLARFEAMGLVAWEDETVSILRRPTAEDLAATLVPAGDDAEDRGVRDRTAPGTVHAS